MYEKLYRIAFHEQADAIKCGYYTEAGTYQTSVKPSFSEGLYDKERLRNEVYPHMLGREGFFTFGISPFKWNMLFSKAILSPILMSENENIVHGEDVAVVIPYLLDSSRFYILDECLYHYRQHPGSTEKSIQDPVKLRTGFDALNKCVLQSLKKRKTIYDAKEDWQRFLVFSMLPYAPVLYRGFEHLAYLFPFPEIKRNSDIILYCAGTYGQQLYKYLTKSHFCNVIAWADKNADELKKQGLPLICPSKIKNYDCGTIVIASSFASTHRQIYRYLSANYPEKEIEVIDVDLLLSNDSKKAFGII